MKTPYDIAEKHGLQYSGDINIEYGGIFFDASTWKEEGYATALRITDLDSACGFTGGILIERSSINRPDDLEPALSCCGLENEENVPEEMEIEACMYYGHSDPIDDCFSPSCMIVTTDPDSWAYDGWKAEAHIDTEDLLGYLVANHFGDFS